MNRATQASEGLLRPFGLRLLSRAHGADDVAPGGSPRRPPERSVGRQAERVDPPLGLRPDVSRSGEPVPGADIPSRAVRAGVLGESLRRGGVRIPSARAGGPDPGQLQRRLSVLHGLFGLGRVAAGALCHGRRPGLARRGSRLRVRAVAVRSAAAHQHAVRRISVPALSLPAALSGRGPPPRPGPVRGLLRLEPAFDLSLRPLRRISHRRRAPRRGPGRSRAEAPHPGRGRRVRVGDARVRAFSDPVPEGREAVRHAAQSGGDAGLLGAAVRLFVGRRAQPALRRSHGAMEPRRRGSLPGDPAGAASGGGRRGAAEPPAVAAESRAVASGRSGRRARRGRGAHPVLSALVYTRRRPLPGDPRAVAGDRALARGPGRPGGVGALAIDPRPSPEGEARRSRGGVGGGGVRVPSLPTGAASVRRGPSGRRRVATRTGGRRRRGRVAAGLSVRLRSDAAPGRARETAAQRAPELCAAGVPAPRGGDERPSDRARSLGGAGAARRRDSGLPPRRRSRLRPRPLSAAPARGPGRGTDSSRAELPGRRRARVPYSISCTQGRRTPARRSEPIRRHGEISTPCFRYPTRRWLRQRASSTSRPRDRRSNPDSGFTAGRWTIPGLLGSRRRASSDRPSRRRTGAAGPAWRRFFRIFPTGEAAATASRFLRLPPGPHTLRVTLVGRDGGRTLLERHIVVAAKP